MGEEKRRIDRSIQALPMLQRELSPKGGKAIRMRFLKKIN